MRDVLLLLTVILLAVAPSRALGAEPFKVLVTTQCNGDTVGERVGFKVREGLKRSASMTAADRYLDSAVQLSIVCEKPDDGSAGNLSRYSYAITTMNPDGHYDFLLTHGIASCGTKRVDECADGLVADIDSEISAVLKRIADGTFKYARDE